MYVRGIFCLHAFMCCAHRYYHGVNVVYKSPPYLPIFDHFDPQLSFSEQDMKYLHVRLAARERCVHS